MASIKVAIRCRPFTIDDKLGTFIHLSICDHLFFFLTNCNPREEIIGEALSNHAQPSTFCILAIYLSSPSPSPPLSSNLPPSFSRVGVVLQQKGDEEGEIELINTDYTTTRFAFTWCWWSAYGFKVGS